MTDKLNYQQASELLGVPVGTLYAWVSRRQIPHHRYSKRLVRFSAAELATWLKENQVITTRENGGGK